MPSRSRIRVVSMCQTSSGFVARMPTLGPSRDGCEAEGDASPRSRNESIPRGRGSKHAADALGQDGEPPGRDVTKVWRGHHAADLGDLVGCELVGRGARARGAVVEVTGQGGASPRTQAGGGESYEPEDAAKTEDAAGAVDGSEQSRLVAAMGDAKAREVGSEQAKSAKKMRRMAVRRAMRFSSLTTRTRSSTSEASMPGAVVMTWGARLSQPAQSSVGPRCQSRSTRHPSPERAGRGGDRRSAGGAGCSCQHRAASDRGEDGKGVRP